MQKLLIIGGAGYIGSALSDYLAREDFSVDSIDLEWFGSGKGNTTKKDVALLTRGFLAPYEAIILLAGHSSVKMCEDNMHAAFLNNVANFVSLVGSISPEQKLIYASSSSVYHGAGVDTCTEDTNLASAPTNWYDLTKREVDWYAALSGKEYYGLRFGTVNGGAPHLRIDLMMNAMYHSAKTAGEVLLYNGEVRRPILGMNDLCRAVLTILHSDIPKPGIYNLASLNSTAREIAEKVAAYTRIPLREGTSDAPVINAKLETKTYDFSIDSSKFEKEFSFTFNDTMDSILESLDETYAASLKTMRNLPTPYELPI